MRDILRVLAGIIIFIAGGSSLMVMLFGIIYEISPILFDKIMSALGFTDGLGFMFFCFWQYRMWRIMVRIYYDQAGYSREKNMRALYLSNGTWKGRYGNGSKIQKF